MAELSVKDELQSRSALIWLAAALDDAPGLAAALLETFAEAPPASVRRSPRPLTSPAVATADLSD